MNKSNVQNKHRDVNRLICEEIRKQACTHFDRVKQTLQKRCKAHGIPTDKGTELKAIEVDELIYKNYRYIHFEKENINISVENFNASFPARDVFNMLDRFERATRTKHAVFSMEEID